MYASTTSVARIGVTPCPVQVEAAIASGGQRFSIVGLPDAAVREAKERVKAAFRMSGLTFPLRNIVVNLSPADLPKAGTSYDLPIALAILAAGNEDYEPITRCVALGELALDGKLRPVVGALGAAVVAADRRVPCLLPRESAAHLRLARPQDVRVASSLAEAIDVMCAQDPPAFEQQDEEPSREPLVDLAQIRGQGRARRALEIAAAGGHHLLMTGPPGSGKTMLAQALPGLLPDLTDDAILEVALAWSAAGLQRRQWMRPPFRAPHHSATAAAMIGGGSGVPVPGEVTLAHRGVLFLDELGEFPVHMLDALRQPLEGGSVLVSRKGASMEFPSRFQLVAATNPCPCGYLGDSHVGCACTDNAKQRYRRRFSGPLLDRIDVRVAVRRLELDEMTGPLSESTNAVRVRVLAARQRQRARGCLNGSMSRQHVDDLRWHQSALDVLASSQIGRLSARGFDRIRRVAATIADLAEAPMIRSDHVAEALQMRAEL